MSRHRLRRCASALCALALATACTPDVPARPPLRILASTDLADMQPILDDLRRETGVAVRVDYRPGVDTSPLPTADQPYDLAWLSSGGYLQLVLNDPDHPAPAPISTPIMLSPVVVGVTPEAGAKLRRQAAGAPLTWADVADGAAAGTLRLAMADPRGSGAALPALVGVATAAAGTGAALRPEDVTCDRLRGFLSGQTLSAPSSAALVDSFVARQDDVEALIGHEATLLSLNASGKLRRPLEIVYPADGIVQSDHPLVLLDQAERARYDTVVSWLRSNQVQERISQRTLRRPVNPASRRDPRLTGSIGTALYFPDQRAVVDTLLEKYADPKLRRPGRVIFVLDYSGSMRGARISALRDAFAGLSGADRTHRGKFFRFYRGERFTVVQFGGRVLRERNFTVESQRDLDALRDFVGSGQFDADTAVWSALSHAYREAIESDGDRSVAVVLMTDGENNAGIGPEEFLRTVRRGGRSVPVFAIRYGEADPVELARVARATGGRMVDATRSSLLDAFGDIRGCY
ncbi:VWA domain-containing protein [Micromonospora sp. NPDC092111]|uniref:vWA domain-containing protein n=1 Tax=Micromonospora sp. NPDC092111 TaxID=3364289 RepID=UPI003816BD7C